MNIVRILIVDDDDINRMVIYALLEEYEETNQTIRFDIHEAVNGLEAVIMAEDDGFDMIFMDINMPGIDGIEATRRIRSYNPTSLIIAVSGVEDKNLQNAIIENGADGYLPKPLDPIQFYHFLQRCIVV